MNKKLQTVLSCRAYRYALNNFQKVRFKYEWKLPTGWDTGIQIYNRINKKNVPLIVSNKNFVKWYICGPTVYDASHIGHARLL